MGIEGNVTQFILMSSAAPNTPGRDFTIWMDSLPEYTGRDRVSSGNLPEGSSLCKNSPHMFPVALPR